MLVWLLLVDVFDIFMECFFIEISMNFASIIIKQLGKVQVQKIYDFSSCIAHIKNLSDILFVFSVADTVANI